MSSVITYFKSLHSSHFLRQAKALFFLLCVVSAGLGTTHVQAQVFKTVEWGETEVKITDELETSSSSGGLISVSATTMAAFGSLEGDGAGGYIYRPTEEFWQRGFDSFQISISGQLETVFLLANLREAPMVGPALNGCSLGEDWSVGGDLSRFRLQSSKWGGPCVLILQLGGEPVLIHTDPQALTGPGGGNTSITLDPGLAGFGGDDVLMSLPANTEVSLAAGVTNSGETVFELVLLPGQQLQARAYAGDGTFQASTPIPLPTTQAEIDLDWWFASAAGSRDGGLVLSIDGDFATHVAAVDNFGLLNKPWTWEFGFLDASWGSVGGMTLHSAEVWTSPRQLPFEPIFADCLTDASLSQWSDVINSSAISWVTPEGARDRKLALHPSVRRFVALVDDSPQNESHYRARFSLDLSKLTPTAGAWSVLKAPSPQSGLPLFQIQIRHLAGSGYQIRVVARTGDQLTASAWASLPATETEVSLQWWRQSSSAGGARLWLDDQQVGTLGNLINASWGVESVSFGTMTLPAGSGGAVVLDNFFSWR